MSESIKYTDYTGFEAAVTHASVYAFKYDLIPELYNNYLNTKCCYDGAANFVETKLGRRLNNGHRLKDR